MRIKKVGVMNRDEALKLLKRKPGGVEKWNQLRRSGSVNCDLSGADLNDADLSRADLGQADLSRAQLRRADLSGADLNGADLCGADLSEARAMKARERRTSRDAQKPFVETLRVEFRPAELGPAAGSESCVQWWETITTRRRQRDQKPCD